ncbi:MAG: transcriptional regulator [Oscillospiraceae bacterium]|nr:transcriptional regulator [Oscillospiraceae bacterium]
MSRGRSIDITGMRSGKLVALRRSDVKQGGSILWLCRCDCGNEILVPPGKIRSGLIRSCGCSRKGSHVRDLAGQRFGRLTALYRLDEMRGSCYLWHCRCDCGNEIDLPVNSLTSGNTTSCGCARRETLRKRALDITGQRFGRLTAVRPLPERESGSVVWHCRCDCGNEIDLSYNSLASGNTRSCGCMRREHDAPPLHYVDGTCVEMLGNRKLRRDNTSGHTGVVKTPSGWHAQICFKKKTYHLGTYSSIEEAVKAREAAEQKLHGAFLEWYYGEDLGRTGTGTSLSGETGITPELRPAAAAG